MVGLLLHSVKFPIELSLTVISKESALLNHLTVPVAKVATAVRALTSALAPATTTSVTLNSSIIGSN
jgi:hypothetical protein